MQYEFELVGKIGSMALIRQEDNDIDYNIFSRMGMELRPGMIWVSSGAAEIGRLDFMKRTGRELEGDHNDVKTDYAAQGQILLMEQYRRFIPQAFGVRQLLVEHQHFNDSEKREHIRRVLLRAREQGAIPIVNYNDPVSDEENRKWELSHLRRQGAEVHECVDNDETAAVIAGLVSTRVLLILTSTEGIYRDADWLHALVENILSLTRLQDGRLQLKKAPEAVEEVIGAAAGHIAKRAPEREITVRAPEELLIVPMDAKLVEQVIVNLLDNALKHTRPEEEIAVTASREGNYARISVSDRGDGIRAEDLPDIFKMFYTTKRQRPDAAQGVGLGLSICEAIVRAHGGTIQARNRADGPGAQFDFTLPMQI